MNPYLQCRREPLFYLELRRSELERRFGPPQHVDLDSNGVGDFDAWNLRFPCGLEVALWWFKGEADATVSEDRRQHVSVRANDREHDHVRFHLGLDTSPLVFEGCEGDPGPNRWVVTRMDDNGNIFEVERVSSQCEAAAIAERYERRGDKQSYWIEMLPPRR